MMKNILFPPQYDQIVELLRPTRGYLVGGAVRDLLLDRPIHDLDFALPENTIGAAKQVADLLGGGFFIMDQERETCRVILTDQDDRRLVVDFTLFQGESIEEDLAARDFTITSMALDLQGEGKIIDPFHGAHDIKEGLIRVTSERSLEDDPLRCLRAVRLAAQLGFRILPETKEQIRRYQTHLVEISPERKRDEFFRLLAGPNQSAGILSMQMLGLYSYILPGELSSHRSRTLRNLEGIWSLFLRDHDQERAASWSKGLLVHRLGRYRENLRDYLSQELVPGRSLYQLSFLLPLFAGRSGSESNLTALQIDRQFPLSNQETSYLEKGIAAAETWLNSSKEVDADQPVEVYRYFKRFGRSGVAAIFLSLGEVLDDQQGEQGQDRWIEQLELARFYLEGYWERHQEWVDPPVLLDGNEIQKEFKLPPGPEIGSLLEILREEQVRSGLISRQEGLEFLKNHSGFSDGREA